MAAMTERTITVLDGGMGKELLRIGAPFRQPEWSALSLMEAPDRVAEAHRGFVEAGAQVITTNTYAVVPYHLGDDVFAARGDELAGLAARLARAVADEASDPVRVAGSLPPLFGSYEPASYRPDVGPELYRRLAEAQADHVDLWLGETISSVVEATDLVAAARGAGPDEIWVSFCLHNEPVGDDAELVSREPLADAVAAVIDDVDAVLFNCCRPEVIDTAIPELAALVADHGKALRLGAYANAFVAGDGDGYAANEVVLDHRADLTPHSYADMLDRWIDAGLDIVGGCCGIRPDHIAELAHRHA